MIGRRVAAWLCVLLVHALVIYSLLTLPMGSELAGSIDSLATEPISLFLAPPRDSANPADMNLPAVAAPRVPMSPPEVAIEPGGEESSAISIPRRVDWPREAEKSAARVLAAEAEAERVAKMFAGPNGTWASLTKRQRSKLSKFRWKPGVDGLERDERGNAIYRLGDGCVLVNFMFIGCALGKPKVHDDLFDNMRLYFDEQRLPKTDEGNGTEPESLRPAD
jgi:hypothetical protein